MESSTKLSTPTKQKNAQSIHPKLNEKVKSLENLDPNLSNPGLNFSSSPPVGKYDKSGKKSAIRNAAAKPNHVAHSPSAKKKIRERKFVIAKKKSRSEQPKSSPVACEKCKMAVIKSKCLCVAYDTLRASQEAFFGNASEIGFDDIKEYREMDENGEVEVKPVAGIGNVGKDGALCDGENGELGLKRSRDKLFREARDTVPQPGPGRVMELVKTFEKLKMMPKSGEELQKNTDNNKKGIQWALPELQQLPHVAPSSTFCPSDLLLTSESLGLDARSFSMNSSHGSTSGRTSAGGPTSRRSSTDSTGTLNRRYWKRKQRIATSQKPFTLRTEQRGKSKEEEFTKKLQQQQEEEEKLRIPIAQGLPWTTEEPECLAKPPVKEITKPLDVVLHCDIRAVERSEFDHQVELKTDLIEQYRAEKERQQKMAEEEEIRRLRKELIPKAQPLPYFDRPFIPKRSTKQPTIPKEPKFHHPQQKKVKCNLSLNDDDWHSQLQ